MMLIWIAFAVLTAAVVALLLRPLLGPRQDTLTRDETALALYKDQMAEIETDLDRGLIQASDAESARAELGRRLLAATRSDEPSSDKSTADTKPVVASPARGLDAVIYSSALLVPVLSIALYLAYGSPSLPSRPHADRMAVAAKDASIDELVAKIEAQLRKEPEDGKGWDLIAPVYARQNRYGEAAAAYASAMRLLGETPKRLFGFARARIFENDGLVDAMARKALSRAIELKPDLNGARFWLATAAEQDGDLKGAISAYQDLKIRAEGNEKWQAQLQGRIDVLQARVDGKPAPNINAVDAGTRDQINQMVARLARRLEQEPDDLDGWLQLIRSYTVLHRREAAVDALATAKARFADQPAALQKLVSLAKDVNMK